MALSKLYGVTIDALLDIENKEEISESKIAQTDFKSKMKSLLSKANDFGIYPQTAKKLLIFPFPIIISFLYISLSMILNIWHPLWMIFLTIPIYYRFAIACKANNTKLFTLLLPVPEMIVTIFLLIGFATGLWNYASILFMIIPLFYWTIAVKKYKQENN